MLDSKRTFKSIGLESPGSSPTSAPCIVVIFGASGDFTKRLLVPAL